MYCKNCGEEIDPDSKFCPHCGFGLRDDAAPQADRTYKVQVVYTEKSEFIAILLSFLLTGLGHIYVGKAMDGIKLLILQILLGVLVLMVTMISPYLSLLGVLSFAVWLYAIYNSYQVCKEYNRQLRDTGYPPW